MAYCSISSHFLCAKGLPGNSWGKLIGKYAQPIGGHWLQFANHPLARILGESPRTTKLYDRTNDAISLDEIERILI